MTTSQWHCRSCEALFETKGKRDAHHRKMHQSISQQSSSNLTRMRSRTGKFICQCSREYQSVQALRKHEKRCKEIQLTMNREQLNEGMCSL
jgi:hypothetical protein